MSPGSDLDPDDGGTTHRVQLDDPLDDQLRLRVTNMLEVAPPVSPLRFGPPIDDVAMHDFAQYVHLTPPAVLPFAPGTTIPPDLEDFLQACRKAISDAVLANGMAEIDVDQPGHFYTIDLRPLLAALIERLFKLFLGSAAIELYEFAIRLRPRYIKASEHPWRDVVAAFAAWADRLTWSFALNPTSVSSSFDDPAKWRAAGSETLTLFYESHGNAVLATDPGSGPPGYRFRPYVPGVVNFGLRLVYRQSWRSLGNQAGEIVRTVPLGPKQTEKITTKVVSTARYSSTSESATSTETSTETATTTKDSSDVVREASSKFGWHVEAEASGGFGPVSAKLSAGMSGENASSSKDTKSSLNEAMSKTASRMKQDTKVVVTTERTESTETSVTSEITNPNDEVAVTYVYSRLQRQYEIRTALAEVASVVLVPETVPEWDEVDEAWVRDNAWVLSRALLDESFAPLLEEIASSPADPEETMTDDDPATQVATGVVSALSEYSKFPGYLPDLVSSSQEALRERRAEIRAMAATRRRRLHRVGRLVHHLRSNILHYMRAIWSAEDADQRLRRYAAMQVPTRWTFVPSGGTVPNAPVGEVTGEFLPDLSPDSLRPLTDVINPAGPIGFAANYAVFHMRAAPSLVDLNEALNMLRASYVRFSVTIDAAKASVDAHKAVAYDPRREHSIYRLKREAAGWKAIDTTANSVAVAVTAPLPNAVDVEGVMLWLSGTPVEGDELVLTVQMTGELEDPELRAYGRSWALPPDATAADFFSPDLLEDMAIHVPEVAVSIPAYATWADLPESAQDKVREHYHDYLMAKEHTRRFVLETNNVVVDLEVGTTSALEEFKVLHRGVDVLKEIEERARRRLENIRRAERLAASNTADPDVSSVVVLSDGVNQGGVGPVIIGTPESPPDGKP